MRLPRSPRTLLATVFAATVAIGCGSSAGSYAQSAPSSGGYPAQDTMYAGAAEYEGDEESMPMAPPAPMEPGDAPRMEAISADAAPSRMPHGAKSASAPAPGAAQPPPPPPGPPNSQQGAGEDSRRSPILIYRADFTMSVFDVQKSLDGVAELAQRHGGYLARRDDRAITIRVPAARFDEVVTGLGALGDVLHRNVVSEDVTAEYRDLEVQLANLLAMRARFEKLLEKAQKVEEALEIERELGRVTSEIERIKGRLKLLSDLAAYSTITVRFEPRSTQAVQEGPFILPLPWLQELGLPRLLRL